MNQNLSYLSDTLFSNTGSCFSVITRPNTGTKSFLHSWKDPSPSISPSNQF